MGPRFPEGSYPSGHALAMAFGITRSMNPPSFAAWLLKIRTSESTATITREADPKNPLYVACQGAVAGRAYTGYGPHRRAMRQERDALRRPPSGSHAFPLTHSQRPPHQTLQRSSGAMRAPVWQWNASWNSGMLATTPLARYWSGECGSTLALSRFSSSRRLPHQLCP